MSDLFSRKPKSATSFTKNVYHQLENELDFSNQDDFEDAKRGFIAPLQENRIQIDFSKGKSDTVNPSLWRNAQVHAVTGLFKVVDGIYQVRGLALATTIIVEGEKGIIVIDTLSDYESAEAAMELYYAHRPKKPVTAVIMSQSHADHFGGTEAVLQYAIDQDIPIIVPEHFVKETYSENVLLGPIMKRRAIFQFGLSLPFEEKGFVGTGIGAIFDSGSGRSGFVAPNKEIDEPFMNMEIDGLEFQFLLTPNTEAPAEMHLFIKNYHALFVSENANKMMHQLYSVRGAKTRDTLQWVKALEDTIELFKDQPIDVMLMIHTAPIWEKDTILQHLALQRDLYKFMHDQTIRLANKGYYMDEIAEEIKLPEKLDKYWSSRGYYGTLQQNVKGIYNFYLGYFNGHPSDLNPLPANENSKKYIAYMGGVDEAFKKAIVDFKEGNYRWVATILKDVLAVDQDHEQAKFLLADTYEQLGYQAESAIWRNIYLTGALKLRGLAPQVQGKRQGLPAMMREMPFEEFFKLLAVKVNAEKAEHLQFSMSIQMDEEKHTIYLKNAVLTVLKKLDETADVSYVGSKNSLYGCLLTGQNMAALFEGNALTGDEKQMTRFLEVLDTFQDFLPVIH